MAQKVQIPPDLIGGDVDEGYGKVADAFRRNLSSGQEVGAAIAVYREGRKVVDLWGGYRNGITRAPWQQDTLVNVFSTTKGIASLAVAVAASRSHLSYDAKVVDYWPEFAQAGKEMITVRQLLAHQAGLPVVSPTLTLQELADPPKMSAKLAAQVPAWTPGTRHGYHGITLGWYEGELIRRTDPAGRSLGRFFADEIAGPLGLDFHIGLPASVDRDRVAHLHAWPFAKLLLHLNTMPRGFVVGLFNPFALTAKSLAFAKGYNSVADFNRDELRVVEMPAVNGTGTARSIAKLYGSAATGSPELGLTAGTLDALKTPALSPTKGLRDKVLHVDSNFTLGFNKPSPICLFGSSMNAFGTPGAGGSFGFADPDTGIGYGYVMNKMGFHLVSDPRELALRQALFRDALGARPQV
jgi:CubicO group peptidase (beta-lactamase class C family)